MEILECIPNVSEGRRPEVIVALQEAIQSVPGTKLLHTDVGMAANRTVFTYIGDPESVCDSTFALYQKAFELIDMREHEGRHPRMGAVDVCPFVPLEDVEMNTAIDLSMRLGYQLAAELGICGYFYEASAIHFDRVKLQDVRRGGYEALPGKLNSMPPDFGEATQWAKFGCTVLGARRPLVAFNVNLETKDVDIAKKIAYRLRTSSEMRSSLPAAKAIGWYIDDFDCVQVSFNLYNLKETGILEAYTAVAQHAADMGTRVCGSELVGLMPESELLKVYRHMTPDFKGDELDASAIKQAVDFLGLDSLKPFDPDRLLLDRLCRKALA